MRFFLLGRVHLPLYLVFASSIIVAIRMSEQLVEPNSRVYLFLAREGLVPTVMCPFPCWPRILSRGLHGDDAQISLGGGREPPTKALKCLFKELNIPTTMVGVSNMEEAQETFGAARDILQNL